MMIIKIAQQHSYKFSEMTQCAMRIDFKWKTRHMYEHLQKVTAYQKPSVCELDLH